MTGNISSGWYSYLSTGSCLPFSDIGHNIIIISLLAIRQCAAWSSTLITHNFPERRKPRKQKETQAPSLPPFCTNFRLKLSTPYNLLSLVKIVIMLAIRQCAAWASTLITPYIPDISVCVLLWHYDTRSCTPTWWQNQHPPDSVRPCRHSPLPVFGELAVLSRILSSTKGSDPCRPHITYQVLWYIARTILPPCVGQANTHTSHTRKEIHWTFLRIERLFTY